MSEFDKVFSKYIGINLENTLWKRRRRKIKKLPSAPNVALDKVGISRVRPATLGKPPHNHPAGLTHMRTHTDTRTHAQCENEKKWVCRVPLI